VTERPHVFRTRRAVDSPHTKTRLRIFASDALEGGAQSASAGSIVETPVWIRDASLAASVEVA
jgi:hypothetical protein